MDRRAEAAGRRRGPVAIAFALALVPAVAPAAPAGAPVRSKPLAGLRAEVAAVIMQGVEGGSLPLAVTARAEEAAPGKAGRWALPLSFEIPGAALLGAAPVPAEPDEEGENRDLRLELYVYAVDDAGRVAGHRAAALTLAIDEAGERLFEAGLRYHDALEVPTGSYSLRFLALVPAGRAFGLAVRRVELAPNGGAPRIAAPRFTGACESWLEAGSGAVAGSSAPPARPVLRAGRASLASTALTGAAAPPDGDWRIRVAFHPPAEGSPPAAELVVEPRPSADGSGRLELEVRPPDDLPQGRYRLRLGTVGAGGGDAVMSEALEVWVLAPDAPVVGDGCDPAWGEVFRLAMAVDGAPAAARPGDAGPPAEAQIAAERLLRRAYLELLREMPAGRSPAAASERLGEAEEEFVSQRLETFPRLRMVELAAAREVVSRDRRCLPILLRLHEEAYDEHFRRRRFGLATHSRELVVALVDEMVAASADEGERRLASGILTSLGDRAERHQVAGAAQRMLELAIELDPENLEARLLLAASYERVARTGAARRQLEDLVAINAGHVEARLRLAVLLAREEKWDESERLLRRLIAELRGGWRLAVAYQTLARLLFEGERFPEAAELLADARAALPEEQRLTLLGAYALDRAGRPAEAVRWIAELPVAAPAGSPRLRYGRTPGEGGLERLRDELDRSLAVRMPVLAQTLAALAEDEG